ncbi:SDR family NAD(P)-dependent oxidoreductase [Microbacterium terricola]|uniref:Oxidoreductase n=1 Tax=Microbacterium terricola TaxID=344163 RepID=A0ABM8DVJ6_9MICO|nr:SDR family oxidoreductase [Microbacterium terricola]UYK39600.1 SDR family oxidoreductase [Microbacterium terricola]BDV29661.1 oxidoreductase [Microbacterium terricola]
MTDLSGATGKLVVVAGGTSAAGQAVTRALLSAGARVVVVGSDAGRLATLRQDAAPAAELLSTELCDLTDEAAVAELAGRIHAVHGSVDGLIHLVGGWRGGGGLAGQTDEDFRFLERSLTALRHVSRAFLEDLSASPAGRLAIVSSTAVARPLAGGANYAAVKAASEAWARAVAQGFAKAARDAGTPLAAASVIFRVTTLSGLEDTLAGAVVDLWRGDPGALNDTVIDLSESARAQP